MTENGLRGARLVALLYVSLVAFGGVAGVLFASVVADPEPPALFFVLTLPPTRLGFAVYGAVTLTVVLGVPLAAVAFVSRDLDSPEAGGPGT